jgi:AraC-like DNA-binding protein
MLSFKTIAPSPDLKSIIQRFVLVEGEILPGTVWSQRILPAVAEQLFINLNEQPQVFLIRQKKVVLINAYVTGQYPQSFEAQFSGAVRLLGVHLYSPWFYQLFNVPIRSLENSGVLLEDLLGGIAVDLCNELRELNGISDIISKSESFIRELMRSSQATTHGILLHSLSLIRKFSGTKPIHEIGTDCKVSVRMLQKIFMDQIGITPKGYSKVYRFNQVVRAMTSMKSFSWKYFADNFGYFDQSHFINDFRNIAKENPAAYFSIFPEADRFFRVSKDE